MSGFFGCVSRNECVNEVFYGTDYHSHLGTKRAGMAFFNGKKFVRSIHSLENGYFRSNRQHFAELSDSTINAAELVAIDFLGQGTIYPDIAESGTKTAKVVKSHHNVGGLPEDMKFELVEPIKQLFKDEVRACGLELGLPYEMVYRQPFPGPGLGVRCLGAITRDRLEALRESDAILRDEFAKCGLDKKVWQYFTVVPDFKSVGVRDNARSYDWPVIIRAVNTVDAMTATIEQIDWPILMKITDRILAEVKTVNRVCYDMSPKPSATIEWE